MSKKSKKKKDIKKRKDSNYKKLNSFEQLKEIKSIMSKTYEVINDELQLDIDKPIHFLKWGAKYNELEGGKIKDMDNFNTVFHFAKHNDRIEFKNLKNTEFTLAWFKKYSIIKENGKKTYKVSDKEFKIANKLNHISNIKDYISNILPYSFILQAEIKLISPYYSRDDDEFYLIQNPVLKEKVFKVPMVRGSGWKGAIAKAGKDLINKDLKWFDSYIRIFGTGSQEYRELIDSLEKDKSISEKLIKYALFKLGIRLNKERINKINTKPEDFLIELSDKLTKENIKNKTVPYLQIHKGRAIFYPTYFDKLSLEIINPHSRKTRAGINPIHYEVVPEGTKGILQIIYIPYDGILLSDNELEKQVKADIEFLIKCIEKVAKNGVGAKTKLGWGQFDLTDKIYYLNGGIESLETEDWVYYEGEENES